jgi:hypothetical protein
MQLEDRMKDLLQVLEIANKMGYSSTSSPMEYLLEAGIDICLLIANEFEIGKMPLRKTPELIFSQKSLDPLGNPKQIRIHKKDPVWLDPEVANFFRTLASFFVEIKNRRSLPTALKSAGLAVVSTLQKPSSKTEVRQKTLKQKRADFAAKQQKVRAYHRRLSKKKDAQY